MRVRTWWREPLVHFLAIGALLFLVFNWRAGGGAGSNHIVITPGQIEAMAAGFARTWQRPPTSIELKGLLDDYVREEIATREAMAAGLDRDDAVIRRRLRQKLEFVAEDSIDATPPTDAQLQAWLEANPESFRIEPSVAFRQVYLNSDRRGARTESDGRRLLEQLTAAGPEANLAAVGDSLMLPNEVVRSTQTEVARQFGEDFADAVVKIEPGQWTGPVRSGYGAHIVFVRERVEGRLPSLDDARPLVEREYTSARRKRELDALYQKLLERYRVSFEKLPDDAKAADAAGAQPAGASK